MLLKDGREVLIRPIGLADAELEREFLKSLSPQTSNNRFMGQIAEPSEALIDQLVDIDYVNDVALGAFFDGHLVGVSRYSVEEDRRSCELAIVVRDAWQRLGLGTLLLSDLIRIARERGLKKMHSNDFSENSGMHALAKQFQFKAASLLGNSRETRYWLSLSVTDKGEPSDLTCAGT